jgi:hypothetical protein
MTLVETISEMGKEMKDSGVGGGEFNYNIFDTL